MAYEPTLTLRHISGNNYELKTRVTVGAHEGLKQTGNVVNVPTRDVTYDVVSGPGGTVTKTLQIVRQNGENEIKVTIKKGGQPEADGIVAYDI